ncbi:hypothetical protein N9C70_01765 [Flavobacteriales bacterium]|nr:hypothetical protein [Flavobacteriales bacterium]
MVILKWFWWQNTPGILLFCIAIPFIEIHTTLLEANQADLTLDDLFFGTGGKTFWMSSLALLAVALGVRMIWALQSFKPNFSLDALRSAAQSIQQRQLILAYLAATFFSQAIDQLLPYSSSLRQLEVYALGVSEALLFLLAAKFMVDRKYGWMIVIVSTYLVVVSFYSFFSSWKDPLTVLLVTALIRISHFGTRDILKLSPILVPAFLLVFVWQNVKGEYRQFLNGGRFSQQVVVSQTEALTKFQELATDALTSSDVLEGNTLDVTFRRVGYLEYFSNAVAKVPTKIEHEKGQLLASNLEFALIPRFLSPNKGLKDDKAKVEKYTDFYFGTYGGSSFSLGHYCEAYIDWGRWGMAVQLFIYGLIGGGLYMLAIWRTSSFNPLLALGILWVCMKPWGTFQQDMVTLTGTLLWGTVCHLLIFFPFYRWANRWIQTSPS